MRKIILIFLFFTVKIIFAQNLVENPSFENVNAANLKCDWYLNNTEFTSAISSWTLPTGGSSDVFDMSLATSCYCSPLSTHSSSPGSQLPRTGNTMSNLVVYGSGGCTPYREYLQGHLSSNLVVGQNYTVEFYVSFADNGENATNNIGVYFTTSAVSEGSSCVYNVTPQLNYTGAPITNSTDWTLISFSYTATDTYSYFILGNFYDDASTTITYVGGPKQTIRYFVDDVSITPVTDSPTSDFTVTQICEGENSVITYTGTGTSAATYNWDFDGGTVVSGSGQGPYEISWSTAGDYDVSLTVIENGNTSSLTTHTVTVSSNPVVTVSGNDFCQGSSEVLDAGSGFSSYLWSTGGSTQTINVNATGTYTVTVSNASACTGFGSISVTALAAPIPSISGDDFCEGETETLDAGSGFNTYLWSTGENTQSINVTATGTYAVTVTDTSSCDGFADISVTENSNPTLTVSGSDFCQGSNEVLDAGSGFTSYLWSTGENTQSISVNISGTYTVTVSDVNTCTASGGVSVTALSLLNPSISGDDFCEGETETLDAGTGYDSYLWSTGSNSQTINVNSTGTYSLTVTATDACDGNTSITVTEFLNPTPSIIGNDFCEGETETLDAGSGYSSYLWNTGEINQTINVSATGIYNLTVTDQNNCSASTDINIVENLLPVIDAGEDQEICSGETVHLTVNGNGGFVWSNGLGTSQQVDVSPTVSTTYGVTLTDANNCSSTDEVTVSVYGTQTITGLPSDTIICFNNPINLSVSGADSYTWFPSYGLSQNNTSAVVVNPSVTTEYTVSSVYGPGCLVSSSVLVIVDKPVVQIQGETQYCMGETANLVSSVTEGVAPYIYLWQETNETSQGISLDMYNNQNLTLNVIDDYGCQAVDNISLSVYDSLHVNVYSNTDSVCVGDEVLVNTNVYGGTGTPYILSIDGEYVQTIERLKVKNNHDYVITAQDACMLVTDTLKLRVYPMPMLDFTADRYTVCEGESIKFNSITQNDNLISVYKWQFGNTDNDNFSLEENPEHVFNNHGSFDVELSLLTRNNCKLDSIKHNYIRVDANPDANFSVDPNVTSIINSELYFENRSEGAETYLWDFGTNDISNVENPLYKYKSIGNYEIVLIATSSFGCKDTTYRYVDVQPEIKLWIPDAFSPDNDGINDVFVVKGSNIINRGYSMQIYDRWGEKIFESNELEKGWNGLVKGNNYAKPGVYTYLINYKDIYNISYERTGKITLVW